MLNVLLDINVFIFAVGVKEHEATVCQIIIVRGFFNLCAPVAPQEENNLFTNCYDLIKYLYLKTGYFTVFPSFSDFVHKKLLK